jgi:hypothetical protein
MKNLKNIKGYVIGGIIGASLMFSVQGFAQVAGDKVEAIFADFNFVINGKSVTLDQTSVVINGDSYLPVRSISNALGYDVTYKSDSRTIELSQPVPTSTPTPEPSATPSPSPTPVADVVDNQVYYSLTELNSSNKFSMTYTSKNGNSVILYKDNYYEIDRNKNYYYDSNAGNQYCSEDILLKMLTKNDLNSSNKYHIDRKSKTVTEL